MVLCDGPKQLAKFTGMLNGQPGLMPELRHLVMWGRQQIPKGPAGRVPVHSS